MWKMDDAETWQRRKNSLTLAIHETANLAEKLNEARGEAIERLLGIPGEQIGELMLVDWDDWPENLKEALPKKDMYQLIYEGFQVERSQALLEALAKFFDEAFTFFLDGFYLHEETTLVESRDFPKRFVVRSLLDQVSFDLDILQQTIHQRQRNIDDHCTQQGRTLFMADRLAALALEPAIRAGYVPRSTFAVTYLNRRIEARLVPYSNTLLIGVAFSTMQLEGMPTRDYLALPHEVGHHIFWNGMLPGTTRPISEAVADRARKAKIYRRNWRMKWVEEIFADTYALLVAGPVSVLDFQDMLDDDVPTHFTRDTNKHPIPELRPLILSRILRQITDDQDQVLYQRAPDKLDQNWRQHLDKDPAEASYLLRRRYKKVGKQIIDDLDHLIEIILDILKDVRPGMAENLPWSLELEDEQTLGDLYEQFRTLAYRDEETAYFNLLEKMLDESLKEPALEALENGGGQDGVPNKVLRELPAFYRRLYSLAQTKDEHEVSTRDWVQLVIFQGWSKEGPAGSTGHG